jgi:pyruvate formate lyase activating enzyme
MILTGLQKLTLLDYPGTVACTVFTGGCNCRCPFCHNSSLVVPDRIENRFSEEEILHFLRKRKGLLDGVAVSGGEPLLQPDLAEFLRQVKELGYKVKLDTNGFFPDRLRSLVEEGLVDRVAMDIKNAPERYPETVGLSSPDMDAVAESKDYLLHFGGEYEFRTTVVRGLHRLEDIVGAAQWIAGAREYYLQQYVDSGDVLQEEGLGAYAPPQMEQFREAAARYVPSVQLRGVERIEEKKT